MVSTWDEYDITNEIRQILQTAPLDDRYETGRRFLTAYQIAIELAQKLPQFVTALGHATGGEGQGPFAITTYVARWLPQRINSGLAPDIEMQFLSSVRLSSVEFDNYGTPLTATANQAGFDMIMFRLSNE